ncbi:MAG: hypothetical protein M1829_000360 [Trizodia sp. TS-e1964]|nr:MAG: hypothetical protein M1829_000360 [Trizodia sp. TS-e1964]
MPVYTLENVKERLDLLLEQFEVSRILLVEWEISLVQRLNCPLVPLGDLVFLVPDEQLQTARILAAGLGFYPADEKSLQPSYASEFSGLALRFIIDETASNPLAQRLHCRRLILVPLSWPGIFPAELVPICAPEVPGSALPCTVWTVPLPAACAAFVRTLAKETRSSPSRALIIEDLSSVVTYSLFDMSYEGAYMDFPANDVPFSDEEILEIENAVRAIESWHFRKDEEWIRKALILTITGKTRYEDLPYREIKHSFSSASSIYNSASTKPTLLLHPTTLPTPTAQHSITMQAASLPSLVLSAMSLTEAQKLAAIGLSDVLTSINIPHAFIGGFAVRLLGHIRETEDIDVEVDVADLSDLRGRIAEILTERDSRFLVRGLSLTFTPLDHPEFCIPVETLPIGSLGLPRRLEVIQMEGDSIPILRPNILILTKIKRCAMLIDSTRPKSMKKFSFDISDIKFLLEWLVKHNQKVDFAGYSSPTPERLYTATHNLLKHWRETLEENLLLLMESVLEQEDAKKVMAD